MCTYIYIYMYIHIHVNMLMTFQSEWKHKIHVPKHQPVFENGDSFGNFATETLPICIWIKYQ